MARREGTGGFYSLRYLSLVAVATIALAMVAWIVQNRQLALAAGVMGLYALHLISIRYILDNQRQHTVALHSQWELLQRLVDPNEPADRLSLEGGGGQDGVAPGSRPESMEILDARVDVTDVTPTAGQQPEQHSRASDTQSWPPMGLPLSTIDSAPDLAIPPGLDMPDLPAAGVAADASRSGQRTAQDGIREPSSDDPFVVTEVPIPRHFALGTVALIRQLLTPPEVARVLMEQRRQPDKRFATLAVEMGLLEDSQREELLLAQQEDSGQHQTDAITRPSRNYDWTRLEDLKGKVPKGKIGKVELSRLTHDGFGIVGGAEAHEPGRDAAEGGALDGECEAL